MKHDSELWNLQRLNQTFMVVVNLTQSSVWIDAKFQIPIKNKYENERATPQNFRTIVNLTWWSSHLLSESVFVLSILTTQLIVYDLWLINEAGWNGPAFLLKIEKKGKKGGKKKEKTQWAGESTFLIM